MQIQNDIMHGFLLVEGEFKGNMICFCSKYLTNSFAGFQNIRVIDESWRTNQHKGKSFQNPIVWIMLQFISMRNIRCFRGITYLFICLLYFRYIHLISLDQIINHYLQQFDRMQGSLGGEIVLFTTTLEYFPMLTIPYPIFKVPSPLDIPSSQSIRSILSKIIAIKGTTSIEELLKSVSLIRKQNIFVNKILIIYIVAVFLSPICTFLRKNQKRPLGEQTRYVMKINSNKITRQSSGVKLQIVSKKMQTNQQAISYVWSLIQKQVSKYGIMIFQRQGKVYVGSQQLIVEFGISLPSFAIIKSQKDIMLVYQHSSRFNGIKLKQFVLFLTLINSENIYSFDRFISQIAQKLQKTIIAQNRQKRFFFILTLDNIFISMDESQIQINIDAIKIEDNKRTLAFNQKESIYFYPLTHNNQLRADFWSIAVILLEVIALKFGIHRFLGEIQSCKQYGQKQKCLNEFIQILEQQKILLCPQLFLKIKKWLNLDIGSLPNPQSSKLKEDISNSQVQINKLYEQYVQDEEGVVQLSDVVIDPEFNIDQYIQNLQNNMIEKVDSINSIFVEDCNAQEINKIQEEILNHPQFLRFFGYSSNEHLIQPKTKCNICIKVSQIYTNYCGHSKCYACYHRHIKSRIQKEEKIINCDSCKKPLSVDLLRSILLKDHILKKRFCSMFLLQFAQNATNQQYICCQNKKCQKNPFLYIANQSQKILLCNKCKISYCRFCRQIIHYPLACDAFKDLKSEVSESLQIGLSSIGWPPYMRHKKKVKRYQQILGIQSNDLLLNIQKIVSQWLVLNLCFSLYNKNSANMEMLMKLSRKVSSILKKIEQFCENELVVTRVEQLPKIVQVRRLILVSIFIQ